MREIFTYGSVGGASGNRCFYPEKCEVIFVRTLNKFLTLLPIETGHYTQESSHAVHRKCLQEAALPCPS